MLVIFIVFLVKEWGGRWEEGLYLGGRLVGKVRLFLVSIIFFEEYVF